MIVFALCNKMKLLKSDSKPDLAIKMLLLYIYRRFNAIVSQLRFWPF